MLNSMLPVMVFAKVSAGRERMSLFITLTRFFNSDDVIIIFFLINLFISVLKSVCYFEYSLFNLFSYIYILVASSDLSLVSRVEIYSSDMFQVLCSVFSST